MKTSLVVDDLSFPEGPRRFGERLLFSDFYRHEVLEVGLDGELRSVCRVQQQPSGLGFTPDGDLLIVSMRDRRLLRLPAASLASGNDATADLTEEADLSAIAPCHCNDMVVDGKGRAYVGNFGFDRHQGEEPRSTNLVMVEAGNATEVADELFFPNGSVITPDRQTLIVAESGARRLTAFRVDQRGQLSARRIWAELGERVPDGICLDAEGAIWVADPRSGGVFRVHEGGQISAEIETPEHNAYACMLGGPERRTLFVCTAKTSGPEAAASRTGRIEVAETEVPGAGWP